MRYKNQKPKNTGILCRHIGWQRQHFNLTNLICDLRRPETEGEGTAAEGAEGKPAAAAGVAAAATAAGATWSVRVRVCAMRRLGVHRLY